MFQRGLSSQPMHGIYVLSCNHKRAHKDRIMLRHLSLSQSSNQTIPNHLRGCKSLNACTSWVMNQMSFSRHIGHAEDEAHYFHPPLSH
jgi:hypothetical protein